VLRVRSIQAFHDEIVRAISLGADYLVVHPGSAKGVAVREALDAVAQAIRQAARGVRMGHLRILLENTAGQGTALGATFSELKLILDACADLPMGVCVDTAHLLAAGFDITTAEGLEKTLKAVEATVGLSKVFVVHVNDSKVPLGARVDRHQHIGKGHIGLDAFRRLLNHPLLAPPSPKEPQAGMMTRGFILETPIDKPGDDARNVAALWKLVGRKIKARRPTKDGFRIRRKAKPGSEIRNESAQRSRRAQRARRRKRG
jgi:deoxyribonuclease-4